MIPNVIHFIFGLKSDFGGKPFSFVHYLAVKSAYECNKPDAMKFHYTYEPSGLWWEKAKPYLTLVKVETPKEIFGNPLMHLCHQADVLRLEILLREGGIYLDMDVLCINSFAPLCRHACVMGVEEQIGLCNAVILAEPQSAFIRQWYESYKTFRSKGKDKYWVEHSVWQPLQIARKNPELIHIEDKYAFFWPFYSGSPITLWDRPAYGAADKVKIAVKKWLALKFIRTSFCVHLWEQLWWHKYLKDLSPASIQRSDNNFAKLSRRILSHGRCLEKPKHYWQRPYLKKLIEKYVPLTVNTTALEVTSQTQYKKIIELQTVQE